MKTRILIAILLAGALSACSSDKIHIEKLKAVPDVGEAPAVKVPALPDNLRRRAARLPDLTDGSPKGVMRDGAQTDAQYNDLAFRYNAVIDAWSCVADAVNNRDSTKLNKCLSH